MEVYGPLHMHRTSTDVQAIDVERSGMALTLPHRACIVLHPCTCMRLSRAVDAAQCARLLQPTWRPHLSLASVATSPHVSLSSPKTG